MLPTTSWVLNAAIATTDKTFIKSSGEAPEDWEIFRLVEILSDLMAQFSDRCNGGCRFFIVLGVFEATEGSAS
ncbi:hypothetical protein G9C98_000530 [Cotesia typhae]|uniref:Uncharacterized protein n=1 Tax=Cotesia typhae TaxID=2053667 RepID=A0A8J5RET4_9HYME|nr:hypothetical protein G9C98_000530 [Cotesia typhae]